MKFHYGVRALCRPVKFFDIKLRKSLVYVPHFVMFNCCHKLKLRGLAQTMKNNPRQKIPKMKRRELSIYFRM